jgi:hypothetical protein
MTKSQRQLEKLLRAAAKYPDSWVKDMNDGELYYLPGKLKLYPLLVKLKVNDLTKDHPRMYLSLFTSLYLRIRVGKMINKRYKDIRKAKLDELNHGICNRLLGIEK